MCPSPWPSSGAAEHRFGGADTVAYTSRPLRRKFYLMSFEGKKNISVLCVSPPRQKIWAHIFPSGRALLFSSCQNTRAIGVFLSGFADAGFELMALNGSNLLCWHSAPSTCTESACADPLSAPPLKNLLFCRQNKWLGRFQGCSKGQACLLAVRGDGDVQAAAWVLEISCMHTCAHKAGEIIWHFGWGIFLFLSQNYSFHDWKEALIPNCK